MGLVIFGYDNNGTNVEWHWSDQKKQYWKTWKPKVEDVIIVGLTSKEKKGKIQQEIWEEVMKNDYPKKEKLKGIYARRNN